MATRKLRFNVSEATWIELNAWLRSNPSDLEVLRVWNEELNGKQRVSYLRRIECVKERQARRARWSKAMRLLDESA